MAVDIVFSNNFLSNFPSFVTCFDKFIDPRLQTAVSSEDVFKVISVHKFQL